MIPFLVGEKIYLRALDPEDAEGNYPHWFNDAEVCAGNSHHVTPYSVQDAYEYIQRVSEAVDCLTLAIVDKFSKAHIGNVSLQDINLLYRSAEFAIVIGDKKYWGKGYGYEAGKLIINHGFAEMGLHRIACGTFVTNTGMRKLAEKLGMKLEGSRRLAAYKNGKWVDVLEYGVLRHEWLIP